MKLALGTAQFGMSYGIANRTGRIPLGEIKAIISLAATAGMDLIDTAISYGSSEACLGMTGVETWKVVTKLPPLPASVPKVEDWIYERIDESLSRLRLTQVHGLLLHRPEDIMGPKGAELIDTLGKLRSTGKVKKIGVSIYDPNILESIYSRFHPDIVQAPFNVIDRRLEISGWLDELKCRGTEIHVRSAFMQGLLLMDNDNRPAKFSRWNDLWNNWSEWLSSSGHSAISACIQFLYAFENIDRIIIGVDGINQLKEILDIAEQKKLSIPDVIQSNDLNLINPSEWAKL